MKKNVLKSVLCVVILLTLVTGWLWAADRTIVIEVAPKVLNLNNQGEVVTVHTDIGYSLVAGATVTLNDVEIYYWKSDNRGNFVAKFEIEDIKGLDGLVIDGYNTMTLAGELKDGTTFEGSVDIKVIER